MASVPLNIWQGWDPIPLGLTYHHLWAHETILNAQVRFWYVIFWDNNRAVGIAQFQLFRIDSRAFVGAARQSGLLPMLEGQIKDLITKGVGLSKLWVLLCGDLYTTAPHGFWFTSDVSVSERWGLLMTALRRVRQWVDEWVNPELVVIKDFSTDTLPSYDAMSLAGFHRVETDPNMVLSMLNWRHFDDYIEAMNSRYRQKTRSILAECQLITPRNLSITDFNRWSSQIDRLHGTIFEKASIRFLKVPEGYFTHMASANGHNYFIRGYFLGDELVGFVSYLFDGQIMQCQYLGLDRNHRQRFPLYPYILLDAVRVGFERRCTSVEFGRTASDMKSSVGAVPMPLFALVKHRNPIKNQLVDLFVQLMHPVDFEPRHVFRS